MLAGGGVIYLFPERKGDYHFPPMELLMEPPEEESIGDEDHILKAKRLQDTLKEFKIECFADRKNIGIWFNNKGNFEKVAAIGVRVSKWIAYHGFCLNITNDLKPYKKIIPCGISDKKVTNLTKISKVKFNEIDKILINKFILNLKSLVV